MIENYEWNDLILYSKGWYEHSGDIMKDVARCLEMNQNRFLLKEMSNERIAYWMLAIMDDLSKKSEEDGIRYVPTLDHAALYGRAKDKQNLYNLPDYETALVYVVLEYLMELTNDKIKLNKPVYGKGRWRIGSMFRKNPISMTYTQMNRMASKMFDKR